MLLYWCSPTYLLSMAAIAAVLIWWLRALLRKVRAVRLQPAESRKPPWWLKPMFACWFLTSMFYGLELGFAAFFETTDAFNATNVSARWFARHVEPYRNQQGFRDHRNLTRRKNDGKTRVVMIGDSFTIAQGVDNIEDRFSDLCETTINDRRTRDSKRVEVFNLGEFGWEVSVIEGMVRVLMEKHYQPDIVVYIYMLNDIEGYDPRTEEVIKTVQQQQPSSFLWTRTYFFNWMHFLWRQNQAKRTVDYFPHLADSYREKPWEGVQLSLDAMRRECEEHGSELRMVFFPFLHNLGADYEFRHAHQQLAEYCTKYDVRYLDLEPILTGFQDEILTVNRYDAHPNERCHAIVAEAISKTLLDDLPELQTETKDVSVLPEG